MAQTFNTSISFIQSTSRKDRRKGAGSISVSAISGGVGSVADSATQSWVRNNFVDKTTEQEISAPKIFSQGIKIGDIAFYKHADGYVYLDETLVLKGGVVMYGNSSGADVPSIFESLPIDGTTIKRDGNGALYVDETALSISGGGGVADSVYWNNIIGKPSWIGSTKPSYKYSEIEERPDLSVYFLASNFTKTKIKSTLGISDWALASAKPTYKYSEISNTPDLSVYALKTSIPTKLSDLTDDVVAGKYLSLSGGAVNGSITATSFIGNLTGNADSATKLDTARKIWGNDFDGSAPISGNIIGKVPTWSIISGEQNIIRIATTGTIITPYDKESGWVAIRTGAENTTSGFNEIRLLSSGNVAIGSTTADAKLHVHGNGIFTDNLTVYSITVGDVTLRKVDNYLYLDSSLVLSGGVTMYGDDGTTVKPIWESIPFDRTTIDWVNGEWTVVGGVDSGGISEDFLNTKLQGYQPLLSATNKLPYSLISGTPDLSVYALKTAIPSKLSELTDDVVAGKYLSLSGGTINKLGRDLLIINDTSSSTVNRGAYITFTSKVGDSQVKVGYNTSTGAFFNIKNSTTSKTYTVRISKDGDGVSYDNQPILHSGNYSDYALPITGGTMTGSITTRSSVYSWANAKTVGHIIAGHNAGVGASPIISTALASGGYGKLAQVSDQFGLYAYAANDSTPSIRFALYPEDGEIKIMGNTIPMSTTTYNLGSASAKWSNVYATSFIGNLTGNADSATKLATARTIWGQSFDGTKDITGAMTVDGDATFSSKVVIGTIPVYQSADGTLFVDANIVFRGGVAMYGDTTTTINEE